jgi:LPPG:FO 2-phospho-L-lactate transferase
MKILALAGGVGGAKFAYGLYHSMDPNDLAIVVNTADDFYHYGLYISPDVDTVCYTISNQANYETGWGVSSDSWVVMENLRNLHGPDWFNLGDRDLATHLERTRRMQLGESLSKITADFCEYWGIKTKIIPMSDNPVQSFVSTYEYGDIPFQEYFVKYHQTPVTKGFSFHGIDQAIPNPEFIQAIDDADWVIICPSNPFVSIQPILSLIGIREKLVEKRVIAISPIIGGKALKGPAAKMFLDQGIEPSAAAVAKYYNNILTAIVIDDQDRNQQLSIDQTGIICLTSNIIMNNTDDRIRLAEEVIHFCEKLIQ